MKTILVPTDFSDNARHALRWAAHIARASQAEIIVLHVNEKPVLAAPSRRYSTSSQTLRSLITENTPEEMVPAIQEIAANPLYHNLRLRTEVLSGALVKVIQEYTEEQSVDLIVMGTRGASGMEELLIGSNTEKVIRYAPCPVLAVPKGAFTLPFKAVVVPTTLHDNQKVVLRRLAALPSELLGTAPIYLLYLNDPAGLGSEEPVQERAQEFLLDSGLDRAELRMLGTLRGDEGDAILEFASQHEAGLIVMGTHQLRGLSHMIWGSLTEDTANHSPIPVLSIPIR
ncbi:universal stress protein [Rhabdobacter roseus]|uniref:Nucleotide-binding universal stress UspA family protein n=1 Tax=Rhabdobacter roseus TaxID=1655419 RepID=A0A840U262_9BACT|nr:universal stress protein [Rhabdobacter roseus]MBB5285929.1 nucleotide-binding universal stress UspA family protein [Rhabdobacter roseus]